MYKAFCEAKALAMIDLLDVNALMVTLPWLMPETQETMAVMGKDFWNYGVEENMREIEALAQYLHEQGLIDRKVASRAFPSLDARNVEGVRMPQPLDPALRNGRGRTQDIMLSAKSFACGDGHLCRSCRKS